MTATAPVDKPQTNFNVALSAAYGQTIKTGVLNASGSPVNFSSGWSFVGKTIPSSNANPLIENNAVGSVTYTGNSDGTVSCAFVAAAAANEGLGATNNWALLGSTDSGTTYVVLATGRITVVQP